MPVLLLKRVLKALVGKAKKVFLLIGGWDLIAKLFLRFPVTREKIRRCLYKNEVGETKGLIMTEDAKSILKELSNE
ncbi:hypothetical protein GCM10027340_08590 [Marinomonas epiphytica]